MGIAQQSRAIFILAQALSLLGMGMNCLSYQQKKKTVLILFQFFGSIFFTAHFFLLGAPLGFLVNLLGAARGLVFSCFHSGKRGNLVRIGMFLVLFLASYPLAFTWLGTEASARNLIVEALPVAAMCLATVSFGLPSAAGVRRFTLFASPLWLTYNLLNRSLGGILSELIGFCSVIVGILRYDRKRRRK